MSLKINVREIGNVTILDLDGRITLGKEVESLRQTIREVLDKGHVHLLLNLAGVGHIDSSGLGQLVGSYATLTSRNGKLKLLNLAKKAYDLMQITKLCTVFEIYNTEQEAIQSFGSVAMAT